MERKTTYSSNSGGHTRQKTNRVLLAYPAPNQVDGRAVPSSRIPGLLSLPRRSSASSLLECPGTSAVPKTSGGDLFFFPQSNCSEVCDGADTFQTSCSRQSAQFRSGLKLSEKVLDICSGKRRVCFFLNGKLLDRRRELAYSVVVHLLSRDAGAADSSRLLRL